MPKRQSYDLDELEAAISVVKRGRLTVAQASRDFGIPRKTIDNHVRGVYSNHQFGPQRMVTEEEEAALVNYMKYMTQQGFPMSRMIVRQYVTTLVRKSGRETLFNLNTGPSDRWFRHFFERHTELTEKEPERQDRSRSRMANQNVMDQYFKLLQNTMDRLGLKDKPQCIFNADETGWSGKEKAHQRVIGIRGQHAYQQVVSSTGHITAHLCICADGRVMPTFLIFEKSFPHTTYRDVVPNNWHFAYSESGYMDSELLLAWFKDLFIPNCGKERPVLLVYDNHDSHINLQLVKLARENNIELLGLPPHTTHILQPLDVGINGPLKHKFSTLATNLGFIYKNQVMNKAKFPAVLPHAIDQFCSPARIKEAFRKTGLYPFNPDAIDKTQLIHSHFTKSTVENVPGTSATQETHPKVVDTLTTCATCGSFIGGNPLVKEGLIPPSLSDIFPPVPAKPQAAKRKLVTEARVITTDEFCKKLEEKDEEDKRRKQEVLRRKNEREKRKKERETEKAKISKLKETKRKAQELRKSMKQNVCRSCNQEEPLVDMKDEGICWIQCDNCSMWYHQVCVGINDADDAAESYFICEYCAV